MRFLILELKLQGTQMNFMYMKLYSVLSTNCVNTLNHIVDSLLCDIIPIIKDLNKIPEFNSNSREMRNRPNYESKLK